MGIFERKLLPLGEKMQQINNNDRKRPWTTAESYVEFEHPGRTVTAQDTVSLARINFPRAADAMTSSIRSVLTCPYPTQSFRTLALLPPRPRLTRSPRISNVKMQDDQSKSTISTDSNKSSNGSGNNNQQYQDGVMSEQFHSTPRSIKQRLDVGLSFVSYHHHEEQHQQSAPPPPVEFNNKNTSTANNSELATCVTAEKQNW